MDDREVELEELAKRIFAALAQKSFQMGRVHVAAAAEESRRLARIFLETRKAPGEVAP